jgi:hypothetical protein
MSTTDLKEKAKKDDKGGYDGIERRHRFIFVA